MFIGLKKRSMLKLENSKMFGQHTDHLKYNFSFLSFDSVCRVEILNGVEIELVLRDSAYIDIRTHTHIHKSNKFFLNILCSLR